MADFFGTKGDDRILKTFLSPGVTTVPAGLTGTLGEFSNPLYRNSLIYGGAGDDVIEGGGFRDSLYGGSGNDELIGGGGKLVGFQTQHDLYGESGNDVLRGTGGDHLYGGTDRDTLFSGDNLTFDIVIVDGGSGADRMIGGAGQQFFHVDSYGDVVTDLTPDDFDTIVTNLNFTLSETGGIENLELGGVGLAAKPTTIYGAGNSQANIISGNAYANVLDGKAGDDSVFGSEGNDFVCGGAGDDGVFGDDGLDVLRGQDGDDYVSGGAGPDVLIGGRGDDFFEFGIFVSTSGPGGIDVITAGDGAVAFEGVGRAEGDVIRPTPIAVYDPEVGFDVSAPWIFGSTGLGGLSCVEAAGRRTLVLGNMDDDPQYEFQVLIDDGAVLASTYTVDDFQI